MAEHRKMRRAALLDAARSLLAEGGARALTFPALAERTGLARSSVYEYFSSRADLVAELCATDFPLWAAEIEAAMDAADTPREKITAYVRQQLALATDQRHQAVVAISSSELDDATRAGIRAAHGALAELVVGVLRDLGHREPAVVAGLLRGIIDAAVTTVAAADGPDAPSFERIAEVAARVAVDGVAAGEAIALDGLGNAEGRQQPGGPPA
ncbi:TetR/AcrR family transcriptional regulator [Streptomyces profundus]|uniref:TetR/AcrR family transcriptional regulator n=1 Tax=Streptomyces profundus TaxID=2867410 RepID=UPI001D169374|nr:TetR/AcrR family transcriptional regulator [Streptomyces sp. MA3_2.13]UED88663.1 TetR/AcrR family transcriptional regulator [Streptomyces sp. MA3_2.13]